MIPMLAEEHEYGKTKLTEAEWLGVAGRYDAWAFVLVEDGRVTVEGPWLKVVGALAAHLADGHQVKAMSHTDYVKGRLAEPELTAAQLAEALLVETSGADQ